MSAYTEPIKFACLFFPILAAIFTVPYVAYQYRKFGSILVIRVCIVYSFILYLTCCYFLIMLPLPPIADVATYTTPTMDLVPFNAWTEFWANTSLVISDPSTYIIAMKEQAFFEPIFNILMLVPLGIYLRYYFKCNWFKTILIGFCVSLSFEVIQLSGLFGIYPRPYRLFQVDDLINNTFGALIGYWISPFFEFFLPSRDRLDVVSYKRGQQITYMRRTVAFVFDWVLIIGFITLLSRFIDTPGIRTIINLGARKSVILYIVIVILYFILIPWVIGGRTPGKILVGLRLVTNKKKRAKLYQYVIRYGFQYLLILPAPFIEIKIYEILPNYSGLAYNFLVICAILLGFLFIVFILQLLISMVTRETQIFYESMSHTINISTVNKKR
ncbi:MAG: VanZ family protein [Eubacterium sp.]